MKRTTRFFLLGSASGMIAAGVLILAARASNERIQETPTEAVEAVAVEEPHELEARTGDRFWGLHLEGVIPCSSMLVRGGGHLVILTRDDRPMDKCSYHVKGKKVVTLDDRRFTLTVTGDDLIHVAKALPEGEAVATDEGAAAAEETDKVEASPEQVAEAG